MCGGYGGGGVWRAEKVRNGGWKEDKVEACSERGGEGERRKEDEGNEWVEVRGRRKEAEVKLEGTDDVRELVKGLEMVGLGRGV